MGFQIFIWVLEWIISIQHCFRPRLQVFQILAHINTLFIDRLWCLLNNRSFTKTHFSKFLKIYFQDNSKTTCFSTNLHPKLVLKISQYCAYITIDLFNNLINNHFTIIITCASANPHTASTQTKINDFILQCIVSVLSLSRLENDWIFIRLEVVVWLHVDFVLYKCACLYISEIWCSFYCLVCEILPTDWNEI
jgi:hypothetical protein